MTPNDGLDRRLAAWLEDEAAPRAPDDLHTRFADGMARTRQRPGWATSERWISMETRAQLGAVPRLVIILATIGLLAALAAGAIVVGSDGPARNGRIAFAYAGDIYTVKPDGTDRQLLVDGSMPYSGPTWSRDGTRLAYLSGAESGAWQLMVIDADGTNPVTIASKDVGLGDVSGYGVPAWSPDGSKLAFTARTLGDPQTACVGSSDVAPSFCSSRVFVAAADGSTGAVQVGDPDVAARTAAWSPDGSMLAFNGGGDAEKGSGLYLMDADGTNVRRIDTVSGTGWAFFRLDWSPDGKSIAATAGMKSWDMWVFAADGSGETRVSEAPADPAVPVDQMFPAYAPDGTLGWGGGASPPGGTVLLEKGGVPTTLAGFDGVDAWSPDGLLIATTTDTAPGGLVIIDRDGTIVTTIENAGAGDAVSWQRPPG